MYGNKLGFELMLNIGLLLIVGSLLAKVRLVQNMLLEESRDWRRMPSCCWYAPRGSGAISSRIV